MSKILGISAFYHDSAAAIIIDGEIIAAAQEERFTRKKHDASFPSNALNDLLKSNNLLFGTVGPRCMWCFEIKLFGRKLEKRQEKIQINAYLRPFNYMSFQCM